MTPSTWIPPWLAEGVAPLLAIIVIVGGFVVLFYKPEVKTEVVGMMTVVLMFFFGSSKGSQVKDNTIKEQLDKKP